MNIPDGWTEVVTKDGNSEFPVYSYTYCKGSAVYVCIVDKYLADRADRSLEDVLAMELAHYMTLIGAE